MVKKAKEVRSTIGANYEQKNKMENRKAKRLFMGHIDIFSDLIYNNESNTFMLQYST